jgi:hypothetical protein
MLHMFTMVLKCFFDVFVSVSDTCFKLCLFFYMLQPLHLNVSKVDHVLHMGCIWEAVDDSHDVRGGGGTLLVRSLASCAGSVRTLAHTLHEAAYMCD